MNGFDKERPVLGLAAKGRAAAGGGIALFPPVGSPPAFIIHAIWRAVKFSRGGWVWN